MDGLLGKQPIVIRDEGKDHDGWGGMWVFALVIIFLAVLFVAFKRDGHDKGHGYGYDPMIPFGAMLAGKSFSHGHDDGCGMARIWHDQAEESGKIRHDLDVSTRELQHTTDVQACGIKDKLGLVIENQNKLAWEAERAQTQRWENEMRDKLAERDRVILEKNSQLLQQDTKNAICGLDNKFAHLMSHVENRLTHIQDKMLKSPPFYPFGGVSAVDGCGPRV